MSDEEQLQLPLLARRFRGLDEFRMSHYMKKAAWTENIM